MTGNNNNLLTIQSNRICTIRIESVTVKNISDRPQWNKWNLDDFTAYQLLTKIKIRWEGIVSCTIATMPDVKQNWKYQLINMIKTQGNPQKVATMQLYRVRLQNGKYGRLTMMMMHDDYRMVHLRYNLRRNGWAFEMNNTTYWARKATYSMMPQGITA